MWIKKVVKHRNKTISVIFDSGYYAHGINKIGNPDDDPGTHFSAWGWINHLRSKIWWSSYLETEFLEAIQKKLHG